MVAVLAPTISWICKWLPIEELFLPGTGSIPWNRQRELRQKMFCLRKKSFFRGLEIITKVRIFLRTQIPLLEIMMKVRTLFRTLIRFLEISF